MTKLPLTVTDRCCHCVVVHGIQGSDRRGRLGVRTACNPRTMMTGCQTNLGIINRDTDESNDRRSQRACATPYYSTGADELGAFVARRGSLTLVACCVLTPTQCVIWNFPYYVLFEQLIILCSILYEYCSRTEA